MNASRCSTASVSRTLPLLTAALLLVQCSMPPQESWRYIQTNGLFSYLHASPPFHTGASHSPRYLAGQSYRSRYSQPSSWYSGLGNRTAPRYSQNSYLGAPYASSSGSPRYIPRSRPSTPSVVRNQDAKIPVEEPSHTPNITHSSPPVSPPPSSSTSSNGASGATTDSLPYGTAVPGRMNMVNSPFAGKTQLVDVSGMSAGQTVKCPYTGKLFKVPPTQQAANHVEPRLESKAEAPKTSDEPKDGDKKP
ncbi:hypothetical protein [Prosthecobacter sp.]|uniref:hypothetical protein n=1 Tax=Prosthecobacter sp. TaxID=1965333 RepID=UPI003784E0F3